MCMDPAPREGEKEEDEEEEEDEEGQEQKRHVELWRWWGAGWIKRGGGECYVRLQSLSPVHWPQCVAVEHGDTVQ